LHNKLQAALSQNTPLTLTLVVHRDTESETKLFDLTAYEALSKKTKLVAVLLKDSAKLKKYALWEQRSPTLNTLTSDQMQTLKEQLIKKAQEKLVKAAVV
jgi:hypothetical protein